MSGELDEIGEALDMEFWCEREGVAFKLTRGSSGMQLNLQCCPFCGDRRYRTYFGLETRRGNCFVCSEGFGPLKFIKEHVQLGWGDTIKHVREVLVEQGWRPKRTTTAAVEHGEVTLPVSFPLPTADGRNLQYLENRGISGELARYFHLRYCTAGWWNFTKDDGTKGGQKFDDRLIIPVYDLDGTLRTFQGRDVGGESDRKYLFPMGLPGTGKFLFNGQNAIHTKRAALGEGAFDVMAMKIAFDEEVQLRDVVPLGSFGKHLSYGSLDGDDQLSRLVQLRRQGLEELTIMWDGEHKALIAALDAAKKVQGVGIKAKIATLPADKDPNEVPPHIVRKAFYEAKPYSPTLHVQWRMRSPFAPA